MQNAPLTCNKFDELIKTEEISYRYPPKKWTPPKSAYICNDTEKEALRALRDVFLPLQPYPILETAAIEGENLVDIEIPIGDGYIAFLENTAEKCTSPETKHSHAGMKGARHWVQRVATLQSVTARLYEGYGISLMCGERYKQYIRNRNNWRASFGLMLDIDVFWEHPDKVRAKAEADDKLHLLEKRLAENETRPAPCYSRDELFERYPIIPKICSFLMPTASSLYEGRPFKARGIVLFTEPITDQRVYRAFGDRLCKEIDCIPENVTKNPAAVGFGNTHNAGQAYRNDSPDTDWINVALTKAKHKVVSEAHEKKEQSERRTEQRERREAYRHSQAESKELSSNGDRVGENIPAFIDQCDPLAEMVKSGLLTRGKGNEYRWHEASSDRSCEVMGDGVLHIFSNTMQNRSPAPAGVPVNAHRFYLYHITGLDLTNDLDKSRIREYLYEQGYGDNPYSRHGHRYEIDEHHQHQTSDMHTERGGNENAIHQWIGESESAKGTHLLTLGSAAGTGKTTAAITSTDNLLYIGKTVEETQGAYAIASQQEKDTHLHRPRMFNRNRDDWKTLPLGLGEQERPCIAPEACNLLAQRGHSAKLYCRTCTLEAACYEEGYLSQEKIERNKQAVFYSWGEEIACDATLKDRVKRIATKDDILIVDEVNPLALTQQRILTRDFIFDLVERFRIHTLPEDFHTLKALLDIVSTSDTEDILPQLKTWLDELPDIDALDERISKYPVGIVFQKSTCATHEQPYEACICYQNSEVTVPVVCFDTAEDTPAYYIDSTRGLVLDTFETQFVSLRFLQKVGLATLDDPPLKHRGILHDLATFFLENPDTENAPYRFNPKTQELIYHLKPTLNHRRVIFNTASDAGDLIGETYKDSDIHITRHDGTPPAWKETTLTFQIATGNYLPRHSLIEGTDKEQLTVKPHAKKMIDALIVPTIAAGHKVLVIAPKDLQRCKGVDSWAETDIDKWTPDKALLVNHHHAEGRNDYQAFDCVFVFHYEPNHHAIVAAAKRIYRNEAIPLDFTRETRTITQGAVSFEKKTYRDNRVQAVYDRECTQRLMQSAMRLRPNLNENKIVVFLTAEPVDIPVTPVAFAPRDTSLFTGDWAGFAKTLQEYADAIATGGVKTLAEQTGISERTARRKTETARKAVKADRDTRILELHAEGMSQRAIHTQMTQEGYKVSLGTIGSIIRRAETETPLIVHTVSGISGTAHPENTSAPVHSTTGTREDSWQVNESFMESLIPKPVSFQTDTGLANVITLRRPLTERHAEWARQRKAIFESDITLLYAEGKDPDEIGELIGVSKAYIMSVLDSQKF